MAPDRATRTTRHAPEKQNRRRIDGCPHKRSRQQAKPGLDDHPLPGNLRDLQRVAWYALAGLQAGLGAQASARDALRALDSDPQPAGRPTFPLDLAKHLIAEERAVLGQALEAADGNKTKAAELLKLPRKTLDYRLEKVGLAPRR